MACSPRPVRNIGHFRLGTVRSASGDKHGALGS